MTDSTDLASTTAAEGRTGTETLAAGAVLGQYRVVRLLGRGGMGEVYEVDHTTLETRHALKLLLADFTGRPGALERFRREAKVMAQLRHENIVHVDDFGEANGRYWLRMELAEGISRRGAESVEERIASLQDYADALGGRVPQDPLLEILEQVLAGLDYAHGRGAIHRDLKPSNILFSDAKADSAPRVKIADFGLVRLVGEEWVRSRVELSVQRSLSLGAQPTAAPEVQGTSTRSLLGTYEYMSPEQKRGEDADARSDIYALGLMTFKLLTGRNPGTKPPSRIDTDLVPAWDRLVEAALEEDRAERLADCAAFRARLADIGRERAEVRRRAELPARKAQEKAQREAAERLAAEERERQAQARAAEQRRQAEAAVRTREARERQRRQEELDQKAEARRNAEEASCKRRAKRREALRGWGLAFALAATPAVAVLLAIQFGVRRQHAELDRMLHGVPPDAAPGAEGVSIPSEISQPSPAAEKAEMAARIVGALTKSWQAKSAGDWQTCADRASEALALDPGNTKANSLKTEAETHLAPAVSAWQTWCAEIAHLGGTAAAEKAYGDVLVRAHAELGMPASAAALPAAGSATGDEEALTSLCARVQSWRTAHGEPGLRALAEALDKVAEAQPPANRGAWSNYWTFAMQGGVRDEFLAALDASRGCDAAAEAMRSAAAALSQCTSAPPTPRHLEQLLTKTGAVLAEAACLKPWLLVVRHEAGLEQGMQLLSADSLIAIHRERLPAECLAVDQALARVQQIEAVMQSAPADESARAGWLLRGVWAPIMDIAQEVDKLGKSVDTLKAAVKARRQRR